MKSEAEVWRELQRVRDLNAVAITGGHKPNPMLHGAEQALGWVLEQLRSPSETDDMMRRKMHAERKRHVGVAS